MNTITTIREIVAHLALATTPVARVFHKGSHFKVLLIGFKSGMILKDHTAHIPSKLLVLSGKVVYRAAEQDTELKCFEEMIIPVDIVHAVEAMEDSICLLSHGS